ncbi:MAG: purine-nucleoside phosphorylase [Bacteroidetes bacterium HGW-Bacteroidetes-1]|nr:MAG: purine-nucleoside phosphorylase [Bacteroidetes bacterium HGW-Bacteroidetes-1]
MYYTKILEAVKFIQNKGIKPPEIGIILGTGLGSLVEILEVEYEIPYGDIPNFVTSTVESHKGSMLFGTLHNKNVVMMQGRFHYYEGYTMKQITFPVRVLKLLGIKLLLISNACGGLNKSFEPASLMLIDDHINFLPTNPLVGPNVDEMGVRFPDMSRPYEVAINKRLKSIAIEKGITLHEGVYAAWIGPSLETRAEYRFLRMAGADAVGMSTVPEVIVANHIGLPVAAVSVVTDLCDPDQLEPVCIENVLRFAADGGTQLKYLFSELIKEI